MHPLHMHEASTIPAPDGREAEIELQVERLLAGAWFCRSKRLPNFLRFVVSETVHGRSETLKERTIGAAVFGRSFDYDTAADPIVRVAAAEIRKRLAQYYQEPGHESELRIILPLGSYVPRFEYPHIDSPPAFAVDQPLNGPEDNDSLADSSAPAPPEHQTEPAATLSASRRWTRFAVLTVLALTIVAAMAVTIFNFNQRQTPIETFWGPVLRSSSTINFYLPDRQHSRTILLRNETNSDATQRFPHQRINTVVLDDLRSFLYLARLMDTRHHRFNFKTSSSSTIEDLRTGPDILIGALDNYWTVRFSGKLRFRFSSDPDMQSFWIEDSRAKPAIRWEINRQLKLTTNNYQDYAIVARYWDQEADQPVVIVAGISRVGTVAAGEFLTQADLLRQLTSRLPAHSEQKNIEAVLGIQVINGVAASPQVLAATTW